MFKAAVLSELITDLKLFPKCLGLLEGLIRAFECNFEEYQFRSLLNGYSSHRQRHEFLQELLSSNKGAYIWAKCVYFPNKRKEEQKALLKQASVKKERRKNQSLHRTDVKYGFYPYVISKIAIEMNYCAMAKLFENTHTADIFKPKLKMLEENLPRLLRFDQADYGFYQGFKAIDSGLRKSFGKIMTKKKEIICKLNAVVEGKRIKSQKSVYEKILDFIDAFLG